MALARGGFGRRQAQAEPVQPEVAQRPVAAVPGRAAREAAQIAQERSQQHQQRNEAQEAQLAKWVTDIHPVVVQTLNANTVSGIEPERLQREIRDWLEREGARDPRVPQLAPMDRQAVAKRLVDEIKGLGPLETLMGDPEISDILVNGTRGAFVERKGKLERVMLHFRDEAHLLEIAQRIAGRIGRRVDEGSPMVDARLKDGSRVNIIIPPLALDGTAISIRRFVMREISLRDMAWSGAMSEGMARGLEVAVRAKLNILVSGGTGAGKTTLMNALSREIPSGERLITIEDAAELQLQQPHVVRLETRAEGAEQQGSGVDMRALLVNTLRMRPDRIIVGEVRGPEVKEMLGAMNTGHPGSMSTLHANNPRDALTRVENMLMQDSGEMPLGALRRQIEGSVDLVIQVERLRSGHRCLTSVTTVAGMEGDVIITEELWRVRKGEHPDRYWECSGRQPRWMHRVEAIQMEDELLEAMTMDKAGPARAEGH